MTAPHTPAALGLPVLKGTEVRVTMHQVIRIAISMSPWMLAIYALYWLGKNEVWGPDTPFRDALSGGIVATGMVTTFLLHSYLLKRSRMKD